jgi:hypothetical protein
MVASPSTFVSNTNTINRIYQAIAIAIGITINNTIPQPPPQQPSTNDRQGPDERCLFDPSLPHCAAVDGERPDGFFMNGDDQCVLVTLDALKAITVMKMMRLENVYQILFHVKMVI